jgi:mono/diheme cytochrome c family protein
MRATTVSAIIIVSASLIGSSAFAAGDPAAGEKLAKEHCVRCHDIGPSGAFKTYPPSFASIAVYRSDEQIYARILFPTLHSAISQMPEFAQIFFIDSKNINDLVAYIRSLEK